MQRIDDEQMRRGRIGVGFRIDGAAAHVARSVPSADASHSGRPEISAPARSASYSREREIAACTSMAATGASRVTTSMIAYAAAAVIAASRRP